MKPRNELRAGVFIVSSLVLLIAMVFILGQERQIFASQEEYYTTFGDVKGLTIGAPVRMGGINVGRVARIGFGPDLTDRTIHVTLLINNTYLDRITMDSQVSIDTQGLLGDRLVSIMPGKLGAKALPKSNLKSIEVSDFAQVLTKAQQVVDNTVEISERINASLEGVSPQTFMNVGDAAKSFSALVKDIQNNKGLVHRLIYSEEDGRSISKSVASTSEDISTLLHDIKSGSGLLHALVYEPTGAHTLDSINVAATALADTGTSLEELIGQAKGGDGLIHDLFYSDVKQGEVSAKLQEAIQTLNETVSNLKVASEALAQGTGTLGALIVDPKLYDNLVEVTDGAKRSFLLRQAIRSSLKQ